MTRGLDLVLYGASGFVGRWAARYLAKYAPAELRWGIAGRDASKLEAVRVELGRPELPIRVADATDRPALRRLCEEARVVITTAGPYARFGGPLVEACVEARTHYADITGETVWVRSLIDRLHARAEKDGTCLVPFAGYDSVPSDVGAYAVARRTRARLGCGVRRLEGFHKAKGGLVSGGTLATFLHVAESGDLVRADSPWLLSPGFPGSAAAHRLDPDPSGVRFVPELDAYSTPFPMSTVNTRVVRRSVALLTGTTEGYGDGFAYQEYWQTRSSKKARAMAWGQLAARRASGFAATRWVIGRLGPGPGEGPSDDVVLGGFLLCDFVGEAEDGTPLGAHWRAEGNPSHANTALYLCETGLLLAAGAARRGGVLTPASALGEALLDRLLARGQVLDFSGALA